MRTTNPDSDRRLGSEIALLVRVEMARQQLSQQRLADKLGWGQPRLSRRITSGKTSVPFTVDELLEVADALGVPMVQLLPPELAILSA